MSCKIKTATLAISLALAFPAFAIDGLSQPAQGASKPVAQQQGLSTSFNPGNQNNPNGQAAVVGGIAANQLASDNDALDRLLYDAINNGNVEDVKSALKAGVNLKLDWTYACRVGAYFYGTGFSDLSSLQTAMNGLKIGEIHVWLTDSGKSQGDLLSSIGFKGYLPSSCQKMHVQHALSMLLGPKVPFEARDSWLLSEIETAKAREIFKIRYDRAPTDRDVFDNDKERERFASRVEILMLLDANTPKADKAFYPLYVIGALDSGVYLGSGLGYHLRLRQIAALKWFIQQYIAAEGSIAKARGLREPSHVKWDRELMTATKAPMTMFDPESARTSPAPWAKQDLGKDPAFAFMTAYIVSGLATQQKDSACRSEQDLKNLNDHIRQFHQAGDQAALPEMKRYVDATKARFDDSVENFTANGLARTSPARVMSDFYADWSVRLSDIERRARPLRYSEPYVDSVISRHAVLELFNWMLTTPATKAQLSTAYGKDSLRSMMAYALGDQSGPAVRALLGEGLLDPGVRDERGRTMTDYALALGKTNPVYQAFTLKEYKGTDCDGNPVQ